MASALCPIVVLPTIGIHIENGVFILIVPETAESVPGRLIRQKEAEPDGLVLIQDVFDVVDRVVQTDRNRGDRVDDIMGIGGDGPAG